VESGREADESPLEAVLRARLEDLVPGASVAGVAGAGVVDVVAVQWHGANFVTLTYRDSYGGTAQAVLGRDHEPRLQLGTSGRTHVPRQSEGPNMIVLGVVLLVVGLIVKIPILVTIGLIIAVLGAALFVLGSMGRAVGGRRHYW